MDDSQSMSAGAVATQQWPADLPQLKMLNGHLQCPICYDYMRNPVISITCSHNYCSLCVRKFISVKTSCPVCYTTLSDSSLRPNRALEEVISCFKPVKDYILLSKQPNPPASVKSPPSAVQCTVPSSSEILGELDRPARASCSRQPEAPKSSGGQVPCPVCRTNVKQSMINQHLDSCLTSGGAAPGPQPAPPEPPPKRKPLPKYIYNLMKDAELRRKLKELGLSSSGDRATLVARHKQYTILYNAECDAVSPRPVEELRAAFEQEEAASRRIANEAVRERSSRPVAPSSNTKTVAQIEEENRRYLMANKAAYDVLIAEVRARAGRTVKTELREAPPPPEPAKQVEQDEDDEIVILPTPEKIIEEVTLGDSSTSSEDGDSSSGSSSNDFTSLSPIPHVANDPSSSIRTSSTSSPEAQGPPSSPTYSPIGDDDPASGTSARSGPSSPSSSVVGSSDFDIPSPPPYSPRTDSSPSLIGSSDIPSLAGADVSSSSRKRRKSREKGGYLSSSSSTTSSPNTSLSKRSRTVLSPGSTSTSDDFVDSPPASASSIRLNRSAAGAGKTPPVDVGAPQLRRSIRTRSKPL